MKGMVISRIPEVLQPLLPQASFASLFKILKILLDPSASISLPAEEIRALVKSEGRCVGEEAAVLGWQCEAAETLMGFS